MRQWAEVDFVPGEKYERKESQPLRYVGLRLLKPQGVLYTGHAESLSTLNLPVKALATAIHVHG